MPLYKLNEWSNVYSKTSGSLWQYYRDEPALGNNGNVVNFTGSSALFKSKVKITEKILAAGNIKNLKIAVPWKYSTFEMTFVNCGINHILTWSADCAISSATGETKLAITDKKNFMFQL